MKKKSSWQIIYNKNGDFCKSYIKMGEENKTHIIQ